MTASEASARGHKVVYKGWVRSFWGGLIVGSSLVGFIVWLVSLMSTRWGEQRVQFLAAEQECFEGGDADARWTACIHRPSGALAPTNGDVVYWLHGRGQDARVWNDPSYYTALIQAHWRRRGVLPPVVVGVSFGHTWLLTEPGPAAGRGLLTTFLHDVIPAVEERTGSPRHRALLGESMGGVNTLLAALKSPGMFQKAAALCPPVYVGTPYDSMAEHWSFIRRTGANLKSALALLRLSGLYFDGEEDWRRHSPLDLLAQLDIARAPEFYLSCGLYDAYGNFEGAALWVERAAELGASVDWRPLYGGHCAVDPASVADFLVAEPR